jgi:hypothetical protein
VKALHSIQDIKKSYEAMLQQAEQIHKDTVGDDYESASKAKNKLAQLLGSIEKLQFNQLDAVTTAHLDSGKAEAKTTRRELNASLDELQEFVRSLYKKFDAVTPPPSPPRPTPPAVTPNTSAPVIPTASHTDDSESDHGSDSGSDRDDSDEDSDDSGDDDNGPEVKNENEGESADEATAKTHQQEAAVGQLKAHVQALAQSRRQQTSPQTKGLKINYKRGQHVEPQDYEQQQRLREQQLHRAHLLREQERQEQLRWQQEQQWREQQRRRYALQQQQQREQQLREEKLRQQQLRQQQLRQQQLLQQQQYYRHQNPRRSMEDRMFGGFYF